MINRNKKAYLSIIAFSLIVLVLVEIGLRIILFTDLPASVLSDVSVINLLKKPKLYADPLSEDDYWKLLHYVGQWKNCYGKTDPILGWTGDFSQDNFIHNKIKHLNNRRPVLLYGDSNYLACSLNILNDIGYNINNDEVFSKDHYLLHYDVGGYGVDQTLLLIQNSIDHYNNPLVVVSFVTPNLDRSILSVTGGQKPYFQIKDSALKLNDEAINPDRNAFFSANPPQIISYLYRGITYNPFSQKYLPKSITSLLKRDNYYKRKKIRINEKIILEIIRELRDRDLDFVFLIFPPNHSELSTIDAGDWRDSFLKQLLDENNVPTIWSKKLIMRDAKNNGLAISDYFGSWEGCPTQHFRKLIAGEMKKLTIETLR